MTDQDELTLSQSQTLELLSRCKNYREVLTWVMVAIEQETFQADEIIEEIERVLIG